MPSKSKSLGTGLENRVVEHAVAAGHRAKKQPLSGVLKDAPNDVVIRTKLAEVLVECKVRGADGTVGADKSVRVEYAWLDKVRANTARMAMHTGVVVFNPKGGRKPMVLLDLDDFLHLLA